MAVIVYFVYLDLRFFLGMSDCGHGSDCVDENVLLAGLDPAFDFCSGYDCDCDFAALSCCVALGLPAP
jgi:hypothetical protein